MNLYEHQSTFNPNMPLRMMRYAGNLYGKYVDENDLDVYGEDLLELPVPKLVVFYNGKKDAPDETILRLSDSFKSEHGGKSDIEVKVRMLNINYGHNAELLQKCRPLYEYSWFIDRVREYNKSMEIEQAVGKAIVEMPEDFEIRAFLKSNQAEVSNMLTAEYHEINALDLVARANKKKGREEGRKVGREEGLAEGKKERESLKRENERLREEIENLRAALAK